MSVDRYAAFELATGTKVLKVGNIWWRRVRPFFYRTLLPFKKYDANRAKDGFSKIGAFQHGVEDGQPFNSYLNPIIFEEPGNYDVRKLRPNVQVHIKKALKNGVTVSRIANEREFADSAYRCYLSFYERTRYAFEAGRRKKDRFLRWSHALFQFPEIVIFGAFAGHELIAFEISCLVDDTLILDTLVTSSKALKLVAPDLLIHTCRSIASDQPNIRMIYDSLLGQSPGINKYYVSRGARVWAVPSFLHMPAPSLWLIRKANQGIYQRLLGLDDDELVSIYGPAQLLPHLHTRRAETPVADMHK
ncbi:MAG: hypothetical protein WA532_02430 [Candidatus Korobacteraceae bacterium]